MESFNDSGSEEDGLLSTWLSHTIQFDSDKYEACEKPMEVYATIGAYSDVVRSRYVGQSPNYACSDGVSLPVKIGQASPEYNSVGSIVDPKAISNYWQKDCISSCPSDQSRAISVSPSSSSSEKEGFHLQQDRYQLLEKAQLHQEMIKRNFDKKVKSDVFKTGDMVLKWDAARQEKGKHGKFDALWTGPFVITEVQQNNTFVLQTLSGEPVSGGPFNGRFLKIYFS